MERMQLSRCFFQKRIFEEVTLYGDIYQKPVCIKRIEECKISFSTDDMLKILLFLELWKMHIRGQFRLEKFPACVLFVDLNPAQIDFNVHPRIN